MRWLEKRALVPFHLWLIIKGLISPTAAAYLPLSLHPCIIFTSKKGGRQTKSQPSIHNPDASDTLWSHDIYK